MDLNQKGSESAEMMNITSPASEVAMQKKSCTDCQTTKTPLWRSGPAGPRSLCNACGIRNRKQRRALLGLSKVGSGSEKTKMKKTKKQSLSSHSSSSSSSNELGVSVNVELGIDMSFQRSWGSKKKKTQLREEEEAAMLLMALSCGSVFA